MEVQAQIAQITILIHRLKHREMNTPWSAPFGV